MKIKHVALWCTDIEVTREFYISYFNATSTAKTVDPNTGFQSYFLIFDNDVRVELMFKPTIQPRLGRVEDEHIGFAHLTFQVDNQQTVDALTEQLRGHGYRIVSYPRLSVAGLYESVILDPDNNRIEIVG
jgi:lactoylglutathione lyase